MLAKTVRQFDIRSTSHCHHAHSQHPTCIVAKAVRPIWPFDNQNSVPSLIPTALVQPKSASSASQSPPSLPQQSLPKLVPNSPSPSDSSRVFAELKIDEAPRPLTSHADVDADLDPAFVYFKPKLFVQVLTNIHISSFGDMHWLPAYFSNGLGPMPIPIAKSRSCHCFALVMAVIEKSCYGQYPPPANVTMSTCQPYPRHLCPHA